MQKFILKADKRTVLGSKVKQLRRTGVIPANLFGKTIESQAIQINGVEFNRVYKEAGETSLIYVKVEGEDKERPTLVTSVHFNPITGDKLHVDFHQVNLKEKVTANVPVEIIGESELVASNEAVLSQSLNEIEIEALPTEIPESITFDISSLKAIGDHLLVSDAKVSAEVEIKTDPEQMVVSLQEPMKEEVIPVEEVPEDATGAETSAEGEAVEGEKPAEGEAKPEEASKE
ncbi:MAG: 50S ribosomal protein L25 [Candidatus Collierbacteria bacterium GW2011_GWB2_42_12]|nr:MAG: 50S ribosomal protein L25 [Candidatus Collierbacteria bacterium GW2011_GWB2_42_12]